MRIQYLYFLTSVFVLLSLSLYGQPSGAALRALAIQFEKTQQLDSSIHYFDSAFHQYVIQKHYASATLAYSPIEKYLLDSGFIDSTHYYMRIVFDSTINLPRYHYNPGILKVKQSLATYYYDRIMYDSAKVVLAHMMPLAIKAYGQRSPQNTKVYAMQSTMDFHNGLLPSATKWMKMSITTNRDDEQLPEMWINYIEYSLLNAEWTAIDELKSTNNDFSEKNLIKDLYAVQATYQRGQLANAMKTFDNINFTPDTTTSRSVILKYNYIKSVLLLEKGEFDEALNIAKMYLPMAQSAYPVSHPLTAAYYEQICRVYYEKSDFGAAREFIEKLIYGMEQQLAAGHPLKAEAYFEYSRLLSALGGHELSYVQIDTAIQITKANTQEEGIFLARCYNQKGVVNQALGQLDSAAAYLHHAHRILDRQLPYKDHIYLAKVLNDLGKVYQFKEIDQNAISDYLKSLAIYNKLLGKVHPHLGTGYYNVGTLYAKNDDYASALKHYQTSLISNIFDFDDTTVTANPPLDNVMSDFILLQSLSAKVEALEKYHEQTGDFDLLIAALDTYNLIANLIDKLRTGYVSQESKRFLGEKTSYLYEQAILLSIKMAEISGEDEYLENAFFFSEKSRAGILLSGIKDANAKKVAGVPDSLLTKEKVLIQQIADKEIELFDELGKGTRARATVVNNFQNELFNLKNQYSDFIVFLEKEYNNYYQLKYDSYSASLDDIQSALFQPINKKDKKNYHLLEYFIGNDSIYIFHIARDTYQLHVKAKPEQFDKMIKGLRNSILYNSDQYFLRLAADLHELLIPIAIDKRTHLTIVPDGILSYLPFESLVAEIEEKPLRKQAYLIQQASISYSYSLTLSVHMTKSPYDYDPARNSFTGFAPVFNKQQQFKVLSSDKDKAQALVSGDTTMQEISYNTLPGSEQELDGIFKKVSGRGYQSNAYFFNAAAKSSLFDSSTLDSRFLHFATHGILDEHNPEFSGIVFTDSTAAQLLTLGEIYGFNTRAEVVTLSACETGLGELLRGEGLVGFSRGFFFSGTKFIIVSLWEVGDASTADMAVAFYQKYAKKKRQDIYKSFQKARLKVIRNKDYDTLSDWFPFVLIGMH